ncbi:MAG TPA: MgtC/SapB family protein [Longimicrobiaceae bacterium]|nr:MgtC/SapB family protein [Longimicrobiaceae bacterium]
MSDLASWLGGHAPWIEPLRLDLLLRLLLAALLGGLIGLERELSGKPAGLRTNLLICVGAALLMELSVTLAEGVNARNAAQGSAFRADPGRIAAQIVSGVGFIGAGTILHARGSVVGLTSAATIWVVAAIGMAVGARAYVEAIGTAVLVMVSLVALRWMEGLLKSRRTSHRYALVLSRASVLEDVDGTLRKHGCSVRMESAEREEHLEVTVRVSGPSRAQEAAVRELVSLDGVRKISRTA